MFEDTLKIIEEKKLFPAGSVIGVACSGGADSMALLHFLNANREKLDIEILALHIDHNTRANDLHDALFVENYCRQNRIRFHKFKVEARVLAKRKGYTLEEACREARYGVFEGLKKRGIVDRIALAHHQSDQAETVLLHILRGSGLGGATGMELVRDDFYVRPFLEVPKQEILSYVYQNEIPYVEDETNEDTSFSRNFLRHKILPELRKVWGKVDESLCSFGKICKEDDQTIRALMNFDAVQYMDKLIKIPLSYFFYPASQVSRLLFDCFSRLGVDTDVEKKHVDLIFDLALKGENSSRLNMPGDVVVYREYEYITMSANQVKSRTKTEWAFKVGNIKVEDYGKIRVRKTQLREPVVGALLIDGDKLPAEAVWRFPKDGDYIDKFGGGGIKKIKNYLSDKKVPLRIRKRLPVLAVGSEVFVIAGMDISEALRVDEKTEKVYLLEFEVQNWV